MRVAALAVLLPSLALSQITVYPPPPLGGKSKCDVYSTPGNYTWIKPAGVSQVNVLIIGGGGGACTNTGLGGGGGGGIYIQDLPVTSNVSITIGAGGTNSTTPTLGGQSCFGQLCANGGSAPSPCDTSGYSGSGGSAGPASGGSGVLFGSSSVNDGQIVYAGRVIYIGGGGGSAKGGVPGGKGAGAGGGPYPDNSRFQWSLLFASNDTNVPGRGGTAQSTSYNGQPGYVAVCYIAP